MTGSPHFFSVGTLTIIRRAAGDRFVQYLGVFCTKLGWRVEFVQYWGVFCTKLGWEGVVVLKYCTFAENYREE